MRYTLSLAVLLFGAALVSAEPAEPGKAAPPAPAPTTGPAVTGTIVVQVVQTSKGGTPVKGDVVTVELVGPGSTTAPRVMKAPVGQNGVAVIDKIPLSPPIRPKVSVTHGGRTFEAGAKPDAEDDVMSVVDTERMFTIAVYDTTQQAPAWEVTVRHVMIQPSPHGTVVSEMLVIQNPSDRAWLGGPDAKGVRSSVVLPLPAGAMDVALGGDLGLDRAKVADGLVVSTAALAPGESHISLRYILPAKEGQTTLEIVAPAPVKHMMVLVPHKGNIESSAEGIKPGDVLNVRGKPMKSYMGENLEAGSRASVVVKTTGMVQELETEDDPSSLPQVLAIVVVGIIVVIGAITLMMRPRKGARQT